MLVSFFLTLLVSTTTDLEWSHKDIAAAIDRDDIVKIIDLENDGIIPQRIYGTPYREVDILHFSIYSDSETVLEYFVDSGYDIGIQDDSGRELLAVAAFHCSLKSYKYLKSLTNDLNKIDGSGKPPIYHAVKGICLSIFDDLKASGADANLTIKIDDNVYTITEYMDRIRNAH